MTENLSTNMLLIYPRITSNKALVTAIDWDIPGTKLLIADAAGNVQIWTNKDHLLNDWTCLGTASFHGENIVAAAFFHNGKKVMYWVSS